MFSRVTLPVVALMFFLESTRGIKRQKLLESLLNASKYDLSIPPDFEKDEPTNVTVQLSVYNMYSVSETNMEYSIDCFLRQWWRDERLSYENRTDINATKLELDSRLLGSLWQPDLYFKNEKKASLHTITNSNKLLHIFRNGTILYSMRIALTLTCTMLLQYFPFDTQTCSIEIASYGYTEENININWKMPGAVEVSQLELAQFKLAEDVTTTENSETYLTGVYSTLKAELTIDRKTGYYALQVIIPNILLVVLSWVSFWVDPKAVPARVSLGVTCVLTMTTQSSGIRQTLPPVSYVKAIDVWMMACLLFVFAALLEFAYVNVCTRNADKAEKYKTGETRHEAAQETTNKDNTNRAFLVDKISRIAFPAIFILFMIVFFCVCLLSSDPEVVRKLYF